MGAPLLLGQSPRFTGLWKETLSDSVVIGLDFGAAWLVSLLVELQSLCWESCFLGPCSQEVELPLGEGCSLFIPVFHEGWSCDMLFSFADIMDFLSCPVRGRSQ